MLLPVTAMLRYCRAPWHVSHMLPPRPPTHAIAALPHTYATAVLPDAYATAALPDTHDMLLPGEVLQPSCLLLGGPVSTTHSYTWGGGGHPPDAGRALFHIFRVGLDDLRLFKCLDEAGMAGRVVVDDGVEQAGCVLAIARKNNGKAVPLAEVGHSLQQACSPARVGWVGHSLQQACSPACVCGG